MDVTDASDDRLKAGVELLLDGHPLVCDGVVIARDNGVLSIRSFSAGTPEFATPQQAAASIARSKQVLTSLTERSEVLRKLAAGRPHEFLFCHDYGMGAIVLAKEVAGRLQWLRAAQ